MKTTNSQKSFFIGSGFIDSQLLFIIPIVHGYCQKKGIKNLIFDNEIPESIRNDRLTASILNEYDIQILNANPSKTNHWKKLFFIFFYLPSIIRLGIRTTRKGLLSNCSWYERQLRHAVWDQALRLLLMALFPSQLREDYILRR